MALSAPTLAALIKTKVQALNNFPETGVSPIFSDDRVLLAFAQAVVEHITGNAVVTVTGIQTGGSNANGSVS